jgi:hypothetical protein
MREIEISRPPVKAGLVSFFAHKASEAVTKARRRRQQQRRPLSKEEATYRLHFWMIGIAAGLIVASMLFHFFQPTDRLWERLIDLCLAFLFGKFTNRIGQSVLPSKPDAPTSGEKEDATA